jgi:3-phosphoshikimate 1-carboxyvinyltransferase
MSSLPLSPANHVSGTLFVPGDKSISHRYVLFGALADGRTRITHLSPGADVQASLACVRGLGAQVEQGHTATIISGWGTRGPTAPTEVLSCDNSGTTMRLLLGLLAGYPISATLTGDTSLSARPMGRVMAPLTAMGATLTAEHDRAPVTVSGGALSAICWTPSAASAQIKGAIMLAALRANGTTDVIEVAPTRDHTERAFPVFGLHCIVDGLRISVPGGQSAVAPSDELRVPGDPSSAAVWAAAAAALPGSTVTLPGVSLNPRRLGFVGALERMGASIVVTPEEELGGEPVGTMTVAFGDRRDTVIAGNEIPGLIDELPVLAASAALGCRLEVRDAEELRVKESDRITALVTGLRAMGVAADELPDGFVIDGRRGRPSGGRADAVHDHRLVMAFAIVALGSAGPSTIDDAGCVAVSYPEFAAHLQKVVG